MRSIKPESVRIWESVGALSTLTKKTILASLLQCVLKDVYLQVGNLFMSSPACPPFECAREEETQLKLMRECSAKRMSTSLYSIFGNETLHEMADKGVDQCSTWDKTSGNSPF